MNDSIERLYRDSMNWQKPLLWLRINLGYIRSEIKSATSAGEDMTGLNRAVEQLEKALATFASSEMWLFEEECTSDQSPHMSAILGMQRPLFIMRNALGASINAVKQEIKSYKETHTQSLLICSRSVEEISKAQGQVREAIDDLVSKIDANVE